MVADKKRRSLDEVIGLWGDALFRLCVVMLRSEADAEDAVQETLLRYMTKAPFFDDIRQEKAWLMRVAGNLCRNMRRYAGMHRHLPLEEAVALVGGDESNGELLRAVSELPSIYRAAVHLHYIEGYSAAEIAAMEHVSVSAVLKRLQRGRELLREQLQN